jgi:two-component system, OmpR family, sensor histidine kinase CpxA
MQMDLRSTLLKKVLLIAFLNLLVLAGAFFFVFRTQWHIISVRVSPSRDKILAVARLITIKLGETDPRGWDALLQQFATDTKVDVRLLDERGNILAGQKAALPPEILRRFLGRTEEMRSRHREQFGHDVDNDLVFLARTWVVVPNPHTTAGRGDEPMMWLLLSSDRRQGLFAVESTPFILTGGLVVLISLAFWLPFVRGLTRTISRMQEATAKIAEGKFETALPPKRRDELGELAESIAQMSSRLDLLVNGQKRFLRDAAHELRSPIARLQVALGLLERTSTDEQRKNIIDLSEDVQLMGELVADVLSYSKAAMQPSPHQIEDVEIEPLVRRVIQLEGNGTEVNFSGEKGLKVRVDPRLLFRALSNLVRNAVRYAGTAGAIEIDAKSSAACLSISVRDSGPGVPEADIEKIFEPFYRLESARERSTGGVGLGLAIVKSTVEACNGSLRCRNRQPHGFEVQIRLPKS